MSVSDERSTVCKAPRSESSLWFETVVVLAAGIALAVLANVISPRGLVLTRDYFPKAVPHPAPVMAQLTPADTAVDIPPDVAERLREKGLQPLGHAEVVRLHQEVQAGYSIVFVDARDDTHYQAGHIPGAYQLNPYEFERYLPTTLPPCLAATNVIVYCNGGECEDSEFAAITLNQAGVPAANLFVYAGGITEWSAHKLPLETGERDSRQIKTQP